MRILPFAAAGMLLLAGCAAPASAATSTDADLSDAAVVLQNVGFETGLVPPRTLRKYLRANTLHGDVTIQTKKNGVRTVVVQRGAVTAVTATTVSVKSSDGFALTWTLGDKLRIVQNRKPADRAALKAGVTIGVAGNRDGDATDARLIAVK